MSRLIYVPQYPSKMRYQEWWISEFKKEFEKHYDEVYIVGFNFLWNNNPKSIDYSHKMFSPIEYAIKFETAQIKDYMSLDIRPDDTLFLADISFPGLFCNVLYHKTCPKMYAFCHATSLNKYDYFMPMRKYKKKIELEHARLFDGIFFGSRYSADKTEWYRRGIESHVVNLPAPPENLVYNTGDEKNIDVVSVCRPSIQKVNKKFEKQLEKLLGIKIYRQEVNNWDEYSSLLTRSHVLLISTKEDTFNYTILDAARCGCVPFAPDALCFPEILPGYWRYNDVMELAQKIKDVVDHGHETKVMPYINCQDDVDNFFDNIIEVMKR